MMKLMKKQHLFLVFICIAQFGRIPEAASQPTEKDDALPRGPFHPKDPSKLQTELMTAEAIESLHHGRPYKVQEIEGYSGTGLLIQDVHAPPITVWQILLDFDEYPARIPKLLACQTYQAIEQARRTFWFTEMTIGSRFFSLNFFVKHEHRLKENVLVWTLDGTKDSDLETSVGYWYVESHPSNEGWSRVTYHLHATLLDWVPSFVWKFMTKQALVEATSWVKTYSEAKYKEERRRANHQTNKQPNLASGTTEEKETSSYTCDSNGVCPNNKSSSTSTNLFTLESLNSPPPPIGVSRYFLVSSVMGLVFFNTYLYFSHYR
jgi:hypothetical protein